MGPPMPELPVTISDPSGHLRAVTKQVSFAGIPSLTSFDMGSTTETMCAGYVSVCGW